MGIRTKAIKVEGVYGRVDAKPANEITVGDILMGRYGLKSKVLEINSCEDNRMIEIVTKTENGYISSRKYGKRRLIAFVD